MSKCPICPICGLPIYEASPKQKYHSEGCATTAHSIVKMRSAINTLADAVLGS